MTADCYLCGGNHTDNGITKLPQSTNGIEDHFKAANGVEDDIKPPEDAEEDMKPSLESRHLLMSSLTTASQTSICKALSQIVKQDIPEEEVLCCLCFELLDQYDTFLQKMQEIKEFLIEMHNHHTVSNQHQPDILPDIIVTPNEDDFRDSKDVPVNVNKRKASSNKNNVKKSKINDEYFPNKGGDLDSKKKHSQKLEASSISCHICLFSFGTLKEKISHILSEHLSSEKATYTCIICGYQFNDLENHADEIIKHNLQTPHRVNSNELIELSEDIEKKYTQNEIACAKCKIYAASQVGYYYHMSIIHEEDMELKLNERAQAAYQYKCFTCTDTFKTKSALKKHEMNVHEERTLSCVHCSKSYKTETAFNNHIAKHKKSEIKKESDHVDLKRYCEVCKRGFKTVRQFAKHQFSVHAVVVPVDCNQCSPTITFSSEKELSYHKMQVHSQQASCHQCGKVFFNLTTLENHLKTQHGGADRFTVICEVCTRMFKNQEQLRQHLKTHSDEREFACTLCTRTFKWDSSLNTHIQAAHNPNGPAYTCPTCQRTFKDKNNLKKHQYTHTDEKPHSCNDCGKGFIRKDLLEKHKVNCGEHLDTNKQKSSKVRVVEVPTRRVMEAPSRRDKGYSGVVEVSTRADKGYSPEVSVGPSEDMTTILMTEYKGPKATVIKLPSSFYIQRLQDNSSS